MGDIAEMIPTARCDTIETRHDLVRLTLGVALSMEHAVLELLSTLEHEVRRRELKDVFSHHADETYAQIENLERALGALGAGAGERPYLPIAAIEDQSRLTAGLVSERFADAIILACAAEAAHHAIAMYESLITLVRSVGPREVAGLLRENLEREQRTLEDVKREEGRIARATL